MNNPAEQEKLEYRINKMGLLNAIRELKKVRLSYLAEIPMPHLATYLKELIRENKVIMMVDDRRKPLMEAVIVMYNE